MLEIHDRGQMPVYSMDLSSGTGDEEPLVDAWVDRSRLQVLVGGNLGKLVWGDTAWRLGNSEVGTTYGPVSKN